MKVLCEYSNAGPRTVRTGWLRALESAGHNTMFWLTDKKSAFDAFNEFSPDIFLGTTQTLTPAIAKCIAKRPNIKVALFATAWGDNISKIDLKKYPIDVVSEQEKLAVAELKATTGRPDFVFIHLTDKNVEGNLGGWRTIGVEPVGIMNAADPFEYLGGQERDFLRCDVGFCGGYWGYKARNLNKYILPLCHPSEGLNVKIFGNQPWGVDCYLGNLEDPLVKDLFKSATVCPNVSEPHSTDLGFDIIERPFKVLASGGFCVSDYVAEAREIFTESELIMTKTPQEFHRLIKHYIKKPDDRIPFINAGRHKVLKEHTYFHRVAKMLKYFGLAGEAISVMESYNKIFAKEL